MIALIALLKDSQILQICVCVCVCVCVWDTVWRERDAGDAEILLWGRLGI